MTPEEIERMLRGANPVDEVVIRDFVASYESECVSCGEEICEGDEAGYIGDDNQASCWDCCQQAKST